jgi:hypothetical protein
MRPPRFRIRSLLIAVAVVAAGLWLLDSIGTEGVGSAAVPLTFRVVDADSGRPIPSARIELYGHYLDGLMSLTAFAGPDGRATIYYPARFTVRQTAIRPMSRSVDYTAAVRVPAEGYRTLIVPLCSLTADRRYHHDPVPPPIVVRLRKAP